MFKPFKSVIFETIYVNYIYTHRPLTNKIIACGILLLNPRCCNSGQSNKNHVFLVLHPKTKLLIYQMYVRSIITYSGQPWGCLISRFNWKNLEFVQNRNLRTILKAPLFVSNTNIYLTQPNFLPYSSLYVITPKHFFTKISHSIKSTFLK